MKNVIWEQWITEKIPGSLGEHTVSVLLPPGYQLNNRVDQYGGIVIINCNVIGYMLQRPGQLENVLLKNAETNTIEKQHIDAFFKQDNESDRLICLESEDALSGYIDSDEYHLCGRVKVPRIMGDKCYWPPSKRALQRIRELYDSNEEITFMKVEGTNLYQAWETYFEKTAGQKGDYRS